MSISPERQIMHKRGVSQKEEDYWKREWAIASKKKRKRGFRLITGSENVSRALAYEKETLYG